MKYDIMYHPKPEINYRFWISEVLLLVSWSVLIYFILAIIYALG